MAVPLNEELPGRTDLSLLNALRKRTGEEEIWRDYHWHIYDELCFREIESGIWEKVVEEEKKPKAPKKSKVKNSDSDSDSDDEYIEDEEQEQQYEGVHILRSKYGPCLLPNVSMDKLTWEDKAAQLDEEVLQKIYSWRKHYLNKCPKKKKWVVEKWLHVVELEHDRRLGLQQNKEIK